MDQHDGSNAKALYVDHHFSLSFLAHSYSILLSISPFVIQREPPLPDIVD